MAADGFDYDLAVIGGGSGGLAAAKEAAKVKPGLRVVCFDWVDPSPQGTTWGLGGTCVNVGCIPKKLMHAAGLYTHHTQQAANLGWQVEAAKQTHSWDAMLAAVNNYVRSLNFAYKGGLRSAGVEYINGKAEFTGPNTVRFVRKFKTDQETLTARHFILATGGRPSYPDDCPGAREYGITSDDLFWRKRAPGRTLVVGGSYIALECAGFLHELGYDVTVAVRSVLLRGFDQQVADQIGETMERSGVRFLRPCVPARLDRVRPEDPESPIRVELRSPDGRGDAPPAEEFDTVLFATGRRPNTAGLGLELAGVRLSKEGRVLVDEAERTSAPHVFAVGDVIEGPPGSTKRPELTPVAIQAGQLLARRLFGGASALMDYNLVPTTVFTPLEYGAVGMSQEEAEARHGGKAGVVCYASRFNALEDGPGEHVAKKPRTAAFLDKNLWARKHALECGVEWPDYEPGSFEYDDIAGQYSHNRLLAKLVVDRVSRRVLGFHYLGPNAGEITQGFSVALRKGATKEDFDATVGIHPTLAEEFTVMSTELSAGPQFLKKEGCGGGGSCG